MKKNIEELQREGEEIARKLGNGVIYAGPWLDEDGNSDTFLFHTFNDDPAFTGTTFTAKTLEEAKNRLIEKRKLFSLPLPNFEHSESL